MRLGRHRPIRTRRPWRGRIAAVVAPAVVTLLGAVAPIPLAAADTTGEPATVPSAWQVASFVAQTPADGWDSGSDVATQVIAGALAADSVVSPGEQLTYALRLSASDGATEAPAEAPVVTDDLSSLDGIATLDSGALPADVTWDAAGNMLTWSPSTPPSVGDSASVVFSVTVNAAADQSTTLTTRATVNGSSCSVNDPCATSVTLQPAADASTGTDSGAGLIAPMSQNASASSDASAPSCSTVGGFEIDGNMASGDCGGIDWATPGLGVSQTSQVGTYDVKSDSSDPTTWSVGGGTPPKVDFQQVYGLTQVVDGRYYAYVAWERSSTTGTGGYAIEIDNAGTRTGNGVPQPDRSAGGIVLYITTQGALAPVLGQYCVFTSQADYGTNCSTSRDGFSAAINTGTFTDPLNNQQMSPGKFMEIGVDITSLTNNAIRPLCPAPSAQASLYLRSFTGNNYGPTGNLKGFVNPLGVRPASTCGELTLVKHVDQNGTTGGTATAANWSLSATATATGGQAFGPNAGSETGTIYSDVKPGSYQLAETGQVNGYTNGTAWQCYTTGDPGHQVASPGNVVTLAAEQRATCVITNTAHQPTLRTTATEHAFAGAAIADTATLTGESALGVPTGTVTFAAYGPATTDTPQCSTTPAFTSDPIPVGANGRAATAGFTPAASGSYYWIATYSGDINYLPVAGACGDVGETSIVATPPAVTVTKTLRTINSVAAEPSAVVAAGDVLGYSIVLTNTGGSPGEVKLTETIPANTTYTGTDEGWTCADGTDSGDTCTWTMTVAAATTSTATPPTVTPGTSTATFTVTVAATLPTGTLSIDNTVTPQGATCTEPDAAPNGCTTTNPTPPVLTVTKMLFTVNGAVVTAQGTPVMAGDVLRYRIVVTNTGGSAGSTTLTETVPVNTTYTGTNEGWICAAGVAAGSSCTHVVTVLAATASASTPPEATPAVTTVVFTVTVDAPVAGTASPITNTVEPGEGATCTDPDATPTGCTTTNPLHGRFQIRKIAANGATLLGAEFALYPDATGTPDTSTSGVTLTAIDENLWATPYLAAGTYWLVETKAPAGYDLLASPVKVTLSAAAVVALGDSAGSQITLADPTRTEPATVVVGDQPVMVLPLLGGPGSSAMTAGGVLLLLLAGGALIVLFRRRPTERRRL